MAWQKELERLVDHFSLPDRADVRLKALVDLVGRDPLAPTTVRTPLAIVRDHIADSLVALELGPMVTDAASVADLGAGAGFPGLPLAIALPGAHISLVEASSRKCQFLERSLAALELPNAAVVCARAEAWPAAGGSIDLLTARALAPLSVVAEYAAPLLRIGGSLVVWRGRRDLEAEAEAARAAEAVALEVHEPRAVHPYPQAENRHLHVLTKIAETPARFPRRPGVAAKRPLGRV